MLGPAPGLGNSASGAAASVDTGRPRRQVGLLVAALAGAALLTACTAQDPAPTPAVSATESPEPRATPTLVASPSPSPSVEQIAMPERPAEMERTDEVGAVAAAEYFMRLYVYVLSTGDVDEWRDATWDGCGFCENVDADVDRVYGAGGRFGEGHIEVLSVELADRDELLGGFPARVRYALDAGAEYDASGSEVAAGVEESGTVDVDVLFRERGWTLMEVSTGTRA